jgi:hypothetical protein
MVSTRVKSGAFGSVFVSYAINFYFDAIVNEFVVVRRFYDPTPPTNSLTRPETADSLVTGAGGQIFN